MMQALLAASAVGLLSFSGAISLAISSQKLKKILIYLVAFSAGSLMGASFFHILPEVIESGDNVLNIFLLSLAGFSLFFILERVLRWHHCHDADCHTHEHLGWMNLIGDGIHNLIDGMVIFVAFLGGPALGIPVTLSIILHEVPQELGDFGVLLYSGFNKYKALFYNFISACLAIVGVLLAFWLNVYNDLISAWLLPFAAGGFIYISASDLIPEIHKDNRLISAIGSYLLFLLALAFMYFIKIYFE